MGPLDRRIVLLSLSFGLAWPALAQGTRKTYRIGVFFGGTPSFTAPLIEALRQGLRELGYVEGQNLIVEYRWAEGKLERVPKLAAELVDLKLDLIFVGITQAALAIRDVTKTTPVVFAGITDPVKSGLVSSLSHPGGNITGLAISSIEMASKRLQLLGEVTNRGVSRLGVVVDPASRSDVVLLQELEVLAKPLGITILRAEVRGSEDFPSVFSMLASKHVDAVFVQAGALTNLHAQQIAQLAAELRVPAIYTLTHFVEAGGLMAYAADQRDQLRRAATYIDKILKGAKPADLAVEQPTRFELVINMKTAKALGITIPPTVLILATELIE